MVNGTLSRNSSQPQVLERLRESKQCGRIACVNTTMPLPCGCFVYLVFITPTQSVPTHKPVRQVLFDLYFAKRELASTSWTSQTACVPRLWQTAGGQDSLCITLLMKANVERRQCQETCFGGATPVHRSKRVILYSSSSILSRSKDDEGTSTILFLVPSCLFYLFSRSLCCWSYTHSGTQLYSPQ